LSDRRQRDIRRDTVTKHGEYAAGGVPEYYILSHRDEHQAFYALDAAGHYVPLPAIRQRDLCAQPDWDSLRADPVYAGFVLPGWTAAEQRAELATVRAETEAARAELATELRQSAPSSRPCAPRPRPPRAGKPKRSLPGCARRSPTPIGDVAALPVLPRAPGSRSARPFSVVGDALSEVGA